MFEPLLGLAVALGLGAYLIFALLNPERLIPDGGSQHDFVRLAGNRPDPRPSRADRAAAGALHGARLLRRAHLSVPRPRPRRAGLLRRRRRRARARAGLAVLYAAMLAFSAAGFVSLYAILRLQAYLPLNPQGFDNVPPDLAFNTAISFLTNTNWQAYCGETTMSHFSQMAGLTVHNFLSAATGIALAIAVTRAFARASATTLGNFWVD